MLILFVFRYKTSISVTFEPFQHINKTMVMLVTKISFLTHIFKYLPYPSIICNVLKCKNHQINNFKQIWLLQYFACIQLP